MLIPVPVPSDAIGLPHARPKYDGLALPLEEYENWDMDDPGFKYEWNNGILEAEESMKPADVRIFDSLQRRFQQTRLYREGAQLVPEVECHLTTINKVRRPDICLLYRHQLHQPQRPESHVPALVIEIISPSNSSEQVESKMHDYFRAGVLCVWHVYTSLQEVRIYDSPDQIRVRRGEQECDAGDIDPDFRIEVVELFG